MKPNIRLTFAFCVLVLFMLPVQAQFKYTVNNGQVTITQGYCPEGNVTIPDKIDGMPVTSIGDLAFRGCTSLTHVRIPKSVTTWPRGWYRYYDHGTFAGCVNLVTVVLEQGLSEIPSGAFAWCTSLASITIPESVTSIGRGAFGDCTSLTSVSIGNDNIEFGGRVFEGCDKLQYAQIGTGAMILRKGDCPEGAVTIPSTIDGLPVTHLGYEIFSGCTSLTTITIPNSVTSIGGSAFSGCSLTSIVIPDSVTSIGGGAFSGCSGLTSITIPNSVTSIGRDAFSGCTGLISVVIGNSVTNIGDYAFRGCTGLTSITIPDSVTNLGSSAFSACAGLTGVVIGNSVTSIGDLAFSDCASLSTVTIGKSVTSIGAWNFSGCPSLRGAYFRGNAPSFDQVLFGRSDQVTVFYLPGTTGWGTTFSDRPTAPWVLPPPIILTTTQRFGIQDSAFGFRISWATNAAVVVEATARVDNPTWSPVSTNTLLNGWSDFTDPDWKTHPNRFYRVRSP